MMPRHAIATVWTAVLAAAAMLAACTPFEPSLPSTPFRCGSADPQCPDGYVCKGEVCTNADTTTPPPTATCSMTFAGALASWDFTGEPGTQTSTAAGSNAPGVIATSVTRSSTLMSATGTNSINATSWPTASQRDLTAYYTLSITAPSGCTLDVSSLAIDAKSSNTGPMTAAVATNDDDFTTTASVSTTEPSTPALSIAGGSASLEIRIYGFDASATTGTLRVQNTLAITGTIE